VDDLLQATDCGLYCAAGDFYVDPWRPVDRAVITHAHSDHARRGSKKYLAAAPGASLLTARLGAIGLETLPYGRRITLNRVSLSFHPAGHILGSSQVRIEHDGHVWVVTGDYKTDPDPTCEAFELVRCHTLVTECTFGLPIYRWPGPRDVFASIHAWWRRNQEQGRTSVIFGYALGKAQRILGGLDPSTGPIFTHGAVENLAAIYRREGITLPPTKHVSDGAAGLDRGLVVAPESANGSLWLRRFSNPSTAFASGWMMIRGRRRQRSVDRGFILSDHVDWPSLLRVIAESGADRVLATHGYADTLSRFLRERGLAAEPLPTHFRGETEEMEEDVSAS
jgi:putative mRNA 3-end processing factor